jgi:hypothetical protein
MDISFQTLQKQAFSVQDVQEADAKVLETVQVVITTKTKEL